MGLTVFLSTRTLFIPIQRNEVRVLIVKFNHQHASGVGFVLGNFLHKGLVVQAVYLFKFIRLCRDFKNDAHKTRHFNWSLVSTLP